MKDDGRPILMIEDTDFDFETVQRGFRRAGALVPVDRCLGLTDAAVRLFGSDRIIPSIIILDLVLGDGDGRELLPRLKESADLCRVPVVVWSASDEPSTIDSCYQRGASSFIRKEADHRSTSRAIDQFVGYWLRTVSLPNEY